MNSTLPISTAAQPAPTNRPTGTAAAEDAANPGDESGFAGLLGAGMGRQDAAAQSAEPTQTAKDAGDEADKDTVACDPAMLLDAIAAGQASVDPRHLNPALASAHAARASQAAGNAMVAEDNPQAPALTPVAAQESALSAKVRAENAKNAGQGDSQKPLESQHPADNRRESSPAPVAVPSIQAEAVAATGAKTDIPERRQELPALLPGAGSTATPAHTGLATHSAFATTFASHVERLAQPFGTAAWEDAFSNRVVWMAKNDVQTASIHLNPPDLGPVEVKLTLTSDPGTQSSASIQFSAAHASTRDAIESTLPRLREMLQENGISLGNTSVDAGTAGHANDAGEFGRQSHGGTSRGEHASRTLEPGIEPRTGSVLRRGNGLVDTFA